MGKEQKAKDSLKKQLTLRFKTEAEIAAFFLGAESAINAMSLEDQNHYNLVKDTFAALCEDLSQNIKIRNNILDSDELL